MEVSSARQLYGVVSGRVSPLRFGLDLRLTTLELWRAYDLPVFIV